MTKETTPSASRIVRKRDRISEMTDTKAKKRAGRLLPTMGELRLMAFALDGDLSHIDRMCDLGGVERLPHDLEGNVAACEAVLACPHIPSRLKSRAVSRCLKILRRERSHAMTGEGKVKVKFRYRDELSHWEWREQEGVFRNVKECVDFYGLGKDCDYQLIEVEEISRDQIRRAR